MYVIVLGAGRIGVALARWLLASDHEVAIIDRDPARCDALEEELGSVVVVGDGTEAGVLVEAGIVRADVFVAATGSDEDNLVACQLAKHHFSVTRTVALVNVPEHERLFSILRVDVPINVSDLLVARIQNELSLHGLVRLLNLPGRGQRRLVGLRVPEGSALAGRQMKDLAMPEDVDFALLISRDGRVTAPTDETRLHPEDELLAITTPQNEEALRSLLSETPREES